MKKLIVIGLVACFLLIITLFIQQEATTTGGICHMRGALPDPVCTPGAINPGVTVINLDQTICLKGWTATVRPPVSYTNPLKVEQMKAYGFTDSPTNYHLDHEVPLEIGGAPTDPKNLWPQSLAESKAKDVVENRLHDKVCAGQLSLAAAQQKIATDWQTALK